MCHDPNQVLMSEPFGFWPCVTGFSFWKSEAWEVQNMNGSRGMKALQRLVCPLCQNPIAFDLLFL